MEITTIPEFILFDLLNKGLAFLRNDYAAHANKNNSFLSKVLSGNGIERYDLVTQAVEVFIDNDISNQRFLEVNMMFNFKREGLPTVHITLPSESHQSDGNGMGFDQGYREDLVEDEDDPESLSRKVYTRRYQSTFNLVITSDNSNEVVMIYHTLRTLLTAMNPSLILAGLQNISFGGQDLQFENNSRFARSLSVSVQYETSAPDIYANAIYKDIFASGTMVTE